MAQVARKFSEQFKVEAVERLAAGESGTSLAEELGVRRKQIYAWKQIYDRTGSVLKKRGRPRSGSAQTSAEDKSVLTRRIAELERLAGKQQALIDFFETALRAVEKLPKAEAGKAQSMKPSGHKGIKKRS